MRKKNVTEDRESAPVPVVSEGWIIIQNCMAAREFQVLSPEAI